MSQYIMQYATKCDHNYEEIVEIEEGDVVVDVGSAEGCFTFSSYKRAKLIIALEPNPFYYYPLEKKLLKDSIGNVILLKEGAYNKKDLVKFIDKGQESHINNLSNNILSKEMLIEVDKLDSILYRMGIDNVDFIKIDIEGAEIEALLGAYDILDKTRKIVVSSYHEREDIQGKTYKWVDEYLKYKGFNTFVGSDYLVHGWKPRYK